MWQWWLLTGKLGVGDGAAVEAVDPTNYYALRGLENQSLAMRGAESNSANLRTDENDSTELLGMP